MHFGRLMQRVYTLSYGHIDVKYVKKISNFTMSVHIRFMLRKT